MKRPSADNMPMSQDRAFQASMQAKYSAVVAEHDPTGP
jgi:hypothetical protein